MDSMYQGIRAHAGQIIRLAEELAEGGKSDTEILRGVSQIQETLARVVGCLAMVEATKEANREQAWSPDRVKGDKQH